MSRITVAGRGSANISAFLDMIAVSELGVWLIAHSDDGYNVCVGSHGPIARIGKPTIQPDLILFDSYLAHPRKRNVKMNSDAAGRYQLMGRYYEPYKKQLGLKDFSPETGLPCS
jgi:hypothetical protein